MTSTSIVPAMAAPAPRPRSHLSAGPVPAAAVRRVILQQARRAHVGHIGSALSVCDAVNAICSRTLRPQAVDHPDRDRFVLSNGHAALAFYAMLHLTGRLSQSDLSTYCTDGSLLGVHPQHALQGVDFTTGSLGQGLSFAVGAALAARLQQSPRRVFAILSDAECNEGSVWEAIMFAAHHGLAGLTVIVDLNGQQALGYTKDVLSMSGMAARWRAFNWDVHEVDGHDVEAMVDLLAALDLVDGPPHVLLARTTFGKGVSFMESRIKWHYSPLSEPEYEQAMDEVGGLP